MAIDGIKFGQMFKTAKTKTKEDNTKKSSNPIEDLKLTKEEKTIFERLRKNGLSKYAAAVMITAMTGPMVTSCMQQETTVNVDTTALQQTLKEMLELQKLMLIQLQQNTDDNKALIEQNKQIMAILQSLLSTTGDISAQLDVAINLIKTLIEQSNKNDKEFLKKLDDIYNSGLEGNELLKKILEANNEQNLTLSNIKTLLDNMSKGQSDLYELALTWFKKYEEGDIKHSEMLENIYKEMLKSNEISKETQNEIKELRKELEAGRIKESEYWAKVIELLQSIDGKLDMINANIIKLGDNIMVGNDKVSDILKEFHEDYKDGKMTQEAYMKKILETMIQSNMNDEVMIGQFNEILKKMTSGQLSFEEAMNKVNDLLNKINDNIDAVKVTVQQIAKDMPKYLEQIINNQNESMLELKDIKNNTTDIKNTLKNVEANQIEANKNLIKIANDGDVIIANLEILKQNTSNLMTKDEAIEFFGSYFNKLLEMGLDIKNGMIDIDEIKNLIEQNKTDLTKTNALIETLTNVVKNMDFNSSEMAEVVKILNDMRTSGTANQEEIMKAFNEALAKLAGIQGSLDALLKTANEINANFKVFMGAAQNYADKFFSELKNITAGITTNTSALEAYAKQANEAFLQSQKMQEEQKAILVSIVEKMGNDNGGNVDIDAIIAKLPNYTQILNDIKAEIGNRPSKDDMIEIINGAKTDLTKTNALIEALTNVVKNLDLSGGGNADMEESNRLIGAVLDFIEKAQLDNAKNFEEYYKLAQKALDELINISQNTKPTAPTTKAIASSSSKGTLPKGWMLHQDTSEMRQMINKYNREQVANYQAMASLDKNDTEREIGLV